MPYPTNDYQAGVVTYNISINAHGTSNNLAITATAYNNDPNWPERLDNIARAARDELMRGDENATGTIWRDISGSLQTQITGGTTTIPEE